MNIKGILKQLELDNTGHYDNKFYIIDLANSDEYATMYSKLCEKAINTESPSIMANTNNTTTKVTNYFELENDGDTYNIFLIANFDTDTYYIKIGEK